MDKKDYTLKHFEKSFEDDISDSIDDAKNKPKLTPEQVAEEDIKKILDKHDLGVDWDALKPILERMVKDKVAQRRARKFNHANNINK
jgi:hypothetical protein